MKKFGRLENVFTFLYFLIKQDIFIYNKLEKVKVLKKRILITTGS